MPEPDGRGASNAEEVWFGDYAHDIRTAIAVINGNVELLADPGASTHARYKALQAIVRASFQLTGTAQIMLVDRLNVAERNRLSGIGGES